VVVDWGLDGRCFNRSAPSSTCRSGPTG
jgi:hypothetical protein